MPSARYPYEFTRKITRNDALIVLRMMSRALVKQSQKYPFCPFVDELREAWRDAQQLIRQADVPREP